jgi:hypothetical protein
MFVRFLLCSILFSHLISFSSALERKRTIKSIPLAEERQILKEISVIKKSKAIVEEYRSYDKTIQETKVCNVDSESSLVC